MSDSHERRSEFFSQFWKVEIKFLLTSMIILFLYRIRYRFKINWAFTHTFYLPKKEIYILSLQLTISACSYLKELIENAVSSNFSPRLRNSIRRYSIFFTYSSRFSFFPWEFSDMKFYQEPALKIYGKLFYTISVYATWVPQDSQNRMQYTK